MKAPVRNLFRRKKRKPRLLGVLLCYNDGDLLTETITHLLDQGHDIIAWDHGSDDSTPDVLESFRSDLTEVRHVPRSFDFHKLYPAMSHHLLERYVTQYDWISWPDQDEFLEGPNRTKTYEEWIFEAFHSPYDWIQFRNFNYWWTSSDDPAIQSTQERIRHYSLFADCAPRIRSWRASATNERVFNHNPPLGVEFPFLFNLRHYPMRNEAQMMRRLSTDRADLERNGSNYHYENMARRFQDLFIEPTRLHFDDGGELQQDVIFNWRQLYGYAANG